MTKIPGQLLKALIRAYQLSLSTVLAPSCRYYPSCSHYALEAVERHGALAGAWLTVKRLARCHPWGGMGFDPVPDRAPRRPSESRKLAAGHRIPLEMSD
ncbi:MAG: membrane protein insertion efficiency factor YidD [Kiloniellales bacterium]|nr:membrane protein insertion efficiency factor YidD [Kiloniellales bacterium]